MYIHGVMWKVTRSVKMLFGLRPPLGYIINIAQARSLRKNQKLKILATAKMNGYLKAKPNTDATIRTKMYIHGVMWKVTRSVKMLFGLRPPLGYIINIAKVEHPTNIDCAQK